MTLLPSLELVIAELNMQLLLVAKLISYIWTLLF